MRFFTEYFAEKHVAINEARNNGLLSPRFLVFNGSPEADMTGADEKLSDVLSEVNPYVVTADVVNKNAKVNGVNEYRGFFYYFD